MSQYERVSLMVGVPTAGRITLSCARGLLLLMDEFRTQLLYPEAKKQEAFVNFQQSSVIAGNRERMVETALERGCTHLLFVDDDMSFLPDAVGILASRRQPIVGVNYRLRNPPAPFAAMSLTNPGERVATTAESTGIEAIDYIGFGLCLIDTDVFRRVSQPWFLPQWDGTSHTTEDLPFFRKAREYGFTAYVDHDASKRVAHVGECHYQWDKVYQ